MSSSYVLIVCQCLADFIVVHIVSNTLVNHFFVAKIVWWALSRKEEGDGRLDLR
jgi:hypothetical protein